jgi:uncharacterized membrane-anchored protein YitT (DUF2179 family)
MKRSHIYTMLRDYFFISIGAVFMGIGVGVFLIDAQVVPGGVTGLSMGIYYLTGGMIPVGIMIWVFNIPLFLWGLKILGTRFGARTFYGFTLSSLSIDFFRGDLPGFRHIQLNKSETIIDLSQNDFLFLILIGSILVGIGLGIIFKFKGSTAGSDIIAAILQKRYGFKPGQAIMFIDFFVISLAGIIIYIKDLSPDRPAMSLTLYAFFLLFVSSKLIDVVLDGFDYARSAIIISDKHDEIAEAIMDKLSRGATALRGRGLYKDIDREVLMTVVSRKEITLLTEIVQEIDPEAFLTIQNVHEVVGLGFRRRI